MTRRGEPQAINQALNRPRAKLGLDLTAWMAIVFVCIAVFLGGFRLLAMMAFPTLAFGAWLIIRMPAKIKPPRQMTAPAYMAKVLKVAIKVVAPEKSIVPWA